MHYDLSIALGTRNGDAVHEDVSNVDKLLIPATSFKNSPTAHVERGRRKQR